MTKAFNIIRNIFAVIGVLSTLLIIGFLIFASTSPMFSSHEEDYLLMEERLNTLRATAPYAKDTATVQIRILQNEARAQEIRDYFQLDTLYTPDADTWTKALAIGQFVATNIPHDNQKEWPKNVNAIGLWEYTKNVAPAFNCRLHSLLTFELLLAAGLDAKYITCMPQDEEDNDCHVVNELWLPELGKWAMLDTDMGGHYVSDTDGTPLSLKEIREHYLSGEKMVMHPGFKKKGSTKKDWYYSYMAKNTYWFSCWGELSYYQEDHNKADVIRDHYYHLVPSGFDPFGRSDGTSTTDPTQFWAPPVH